MPFGILCRHGFNFRKNVSKPSLASVFLNRSRTRLFSTNMGALGQHKVDTSERLAKLRELMKKRGVDTFVVPSEDQRVYPTVLVLMV